MSAKKLGSYPTASVFITITAALFMVGLFALFALHATALTKLLQENIEIQVYLDKDIDEKAQAEILQTLAKQDFIKIENNQPKVRFLSKEEAAKKLIADMGEDFVTSLGTNPLRDVLIINIKSEYSSKEKLLGIRSQLESYNGIFEVVYAEVAIEKINENLTSIGSFAVGFAVLLFLITFFLLNNAIKLALYSQRMLIRSMQLVGATHFFIVKPFLWRAGVQGFAGGTVACGLLSALLFYVNSQFAEMAAIQNLWLVALLFVLLVALGTFICLLSAYTAVNRYLNMSLDQLND
jgi:cell division transport system permease protein